MAIPTPGAASPHAAETNKLLEKLLLATKTNTAATVASGMIAASGRAHSVQEAMKLVSNIQFALFPMPGYGAYEAWAKERDSHMERVHA